jgi:hypothetical protein
MPFVHVEDVRHGVALDGGEGADGPHPADTEQQLLFDAVFLVAAIKPGGDVAQVVVVLLDVGVQQQQSNSANLGDPHPGPQHARLGHRHLDEHRRAAEMSQQANRQSLRVQRRVVLVLPAFGGQRLAEVAGPVVQAHPDQRQAQI